MSQPIVSTTNNAPLSASSQANMLHSAYRVAYQDPEFLGREDMRGARMLLEYQKTESALKDMNVESTVVVFGSARVMSPEQVEAALMAARTPEEKAYAQLRAKQAPWYEMSREFGKIVSLRGGAMDSVPGVPLRNVIATGGGPGLMSAANQGAHDVGAPSIGYNITLEHEQAPNPYSTPELTFLHRFFGVRKMHMALRAGGLPKVVTTGTGESRFVGTSGGLAVMPGGYGTMDEVYEIANLITCNKMPMIPIVLFNRAFWESTCNFQALLEHGLISKNALDIFSYAETAEEGWQLMQDRQKIILATGG